MAEGSPKPHVQRLLEAIASIMGLDRGQQRLELCFDEGHLRSWWSHHEKRRPGELVAYDEEASWLVARPSPED